jgi:hypothetical protein
MEVLNMKNDTLVMIVILGLVIAYFQGWIPGIGDGAPAPTGPSGQVCDTTTTPDLDINAHEVDNPGTANTEANNIYRKIGDTAWSTFTLGTAETNLEPFASYEFAVGTNTSAVTTRANAYGPFFEHSIKCQEIETLDVAVYPDETYDGLTATFYDADDNAAGEAFSAGVVQTVSIKWSAGKDEYYGNPYIASSKLSDQGAHRKKYPNVLGLKLNSTTWETPQSVSFVRQDGTGDTLNRISCPTIADTASTHITFCYEAPVIDDTITRFYLRLEPDGSVAATVDDTAYLYAGNFFMNTDTAEISWGVEDNDAAYVGGNGDADEATLDFT